MLLARRAVLVVVLFALALPSWHAAAEEPALLRYEPPPVDLVYPAAADEGPDAGAAPDARSPPDAAPAPALAVPDAGPAPAPARAPPTRLVEPVKPPEPAPAPASAEPAEPEYGARASAKHNAAPAPRGTRRISMAHARDLPGAFGDPLRVLEALPGVVPLTSGLPYVYIRGAPPAAQGFVYDDIPLPQLFHAAFGPAMLHPRATGDVRLDAGIPEARYGRRLGGLLLAEGTPLLRELGAEVEVRAIDLGGWIQAPVGKGAFALSGRIGYPNLVLKLAEQMGVVDPGTRLRYGNMQLRFRHPLGRRDDIELVWLGAIDMLQLPGLSNDPRAGASKTHFQRVETRVIHQLPRGEIGVAVRFGFDTSELGTALSVRAFTFGPRMWTQLKLGDHVVRVGADLIGAMGEVVNGSGAIASPDGDLRINLPSIAQAPGRNQGGAYVQDTFHLGARTLVQAGLRIDYWSVRSNLAFGVDPRLRVSYDITPKLDIHAAIGSTHQPAVFLLPTAGLTDVAVDRGLMRALQSELGVGYQLTKSTRVELTGYYHRYYNMLLPELVTDGIVPENPPLVTSNAYGLEAFLFRDLSETVSGWLSYTLGFADADSGPEVVGKFKPDYDVRHMLNLVLAWRVWRGLSLSGRFQARSGRVVEQLNPSYTQRLPWFTRADARVGYTWRSRFANMTAYLEWLNLFVQPEYTDADCLLGECTAKRAPVIAIPNLGVRAEF
jgi:TonB dependent receptor